MSVENWKRNEFAKTEMKIYFNNLNALTSAVLNVFIPSFIEFLTTYMV